MVCTTPVDGRAATWYGLITCGHQTVLAMSALCLVACLKAKEINVQISVNLPVSLDTSLWRHGDVLFLMVY